MERAPHLEPVYSPPTDIVVSDADTGEVIHVDAQKPFIVDNKEVGAATSHYDESDPHSWNFPQTD
jgi:hypothetical protein